jgi:hypothetical protein
VQHPSIEDRGELRIRAEVATPQQMPGRDAYLDGLLERLRHKFLKAAMTRLSRARVTDNFIGIPRANWVVVMAAAISPRACRAYGVARVCDGFGVARNISNRQFHPLAGLSTSYI